MSVWWWEDDDDDYGSSDESEMAALEADQDDEANVCTCGECKRCVDTLDSDGDELGEWW